MSLLTICQSVADETGQPTPSSIASSSSAIAKRLLRLANREGKDLLAAHDWSVLRKEKTYTASGSTSSALLTAIFTDGDFSRLVNDTWWDRTENRPLKLSNPQEWQLLQSGVVGLTGNRRYFIQRGSSLHFDPALPNAQVLAFEYISANWCQSSGGTGKAAFTADTDTGVLDERLIELGLKWRFLASLRRSYQEEKAEYAEELRKAILRDGGRTKIRMGGSGVGGFLNDGNIPDSGFGS